MAVKKEQGEGRSRIFDTSICHALFRRARVDPSRKRSFDPDRKLNFDHNRKIAARMKGVQFREGYAIGFRHMLLDNIDDISDPKEWVDMGKAKMPETYVKEEVKDWEKRWGKDESFEEKWKLPKKYVKGSKPPNKAPVKEPVQAKVVWEDSISPANKKRANALNEYGLTLMELKDYDQAIRYFVKAIEMDPLEGTYRVNRDRCMDWIRYMKRSGNR